MNVFVVAMSAPAAKYASWVSEIEGRPREVQDVRVALDVAPVVAKKLASVVRLGEPTTVDEDAPRPVEHDDAPVEDLSQPFGRGHVSPSGAAFRLESPTEVRAGGSLGVW